MKSLSLLLSLFEYHVLWPLLYGVFKLCNRPDPKTVLFADSYSSTLTDNMKPIYSELEKLGDYTLLTSFPKKAAKTSGIGKLKARLSRSFAAIGFLKKYAKSGALIITDSFLPAYCVKPRAGTKVIQLWHGCGAFKKWGYSTLDNSFGATRKEAKRFPMHNCYTLVPISAQAVAFAYADAFACDKEIIKPLGVPRTDVYFDNDFIHSAKDKLCEIYPELKGRKIILYAPTFRGENITSANNGVTLDFTILNHFLSSLNEDTHSTYEDPKISFVCKLHPFVSDKPCVPYLSNPSKTKDANGDEEQEQFAPQIIDVSTVDIDILLCAADILITDYSSVIFEYSLLERPMLFYPYDLESYTAERDFYYPYKSFVPGDIVTSQFALHSSIRMLSKQIIDKPHYCPLEVKAFKRTYMSACDGSSTKRIVDYITDNTSIED